MGKGKGKARGASPKGGTRKIASLLKAPTAASTVTTTATSPKSKPPKATSSTTATISSGGSNKKSGTRKPRPSDSSSTTATSSGATSSQSGGGVVAGSSSSGSSGTSVGADSSVSAADELFKLTCTCPHLVQHPDRAELLRKLVDVRIEVNMSVMVKQRSTVGVFGAMEGEGMGYAAYQCQECEEHTLDEPDDVLTCLGCGYTGCGSLPNRHLLRHCLTMPGDGHCFAASRARAELFCALCCDYVYDAEFDAAVSRTDDDFGFPREWVGCGEGGGGGGGSGQGNDASVRNKRRRRARSEGHYLVTDRFGQQPWRERAWPPPVLLSPRKGRLVAAGVRGMFNLGNTCFMSSVLQAVLHISVMQSFFFGNGHEPTRCENLRKETARLRAQILQFDGNASFDGLNGGDGGDSAAAKGQEGIGRKSGTAKKLGDYCIACELARLFQDMFSTEAADATLDDAEPYVPHRLLEAVWGASDALAGYEQQDAHEFLIAVLDNLHGHLDRAATNEISAKSLRRTLAAHKQHAKQQQHRQHKGGPGGGTTVRGGVKGGDDNVSPLSPVSGGGSEGRGGSGGSSADKKSRRHGRKSVGTDANVTGWEDTSRRSTMVGFDEQDDLDLRGTQSTPGKLHPQQSPSGPARAGTRGGGYRDKKERDEQASASAQGTFGQHVVGSAIVDSTVNRCPLAPGNFAKGGHAFSAISPARRVSRIASNGANGFCVKEEAVDGDDGRTLVVTSSGSNGALNGQRLEDLNLAGFVQEVFAGVTRSDVVCTACGDVSCTYERFLEVSLPVRPGEHELAQQQSKPEVKSSRSSLVRGAGAGAPSTVAVARRTTGGGEGGGVGGTISSTSLTSSGATNGERVSVSSAAKLPWGNNHSNHNGGIGMIQSGSASAAQATLGGDDGIGAPAPVEGSKVNGNARSFSSLSASPMSTSTSSSTTLPLLLPPLPPTPGARSPTSSKAGSASGSGRVSPGCSDTLSTESRATSTTERVSPSSTMSEESGSFSAAGEDGGGGSDGKPQRHTASGGGGVGAASLPPGRVLGVVARKEARRNGRVKDFDVRSIRDCFARFAAREELAAPMRCDSCATSVCKTKQMSFCSLPRVLVLHLKRFDAMADRKIDDFVSFPARGLDMGQYLTGWPSSGSPGADCSSVSSTPPPMPPDAAGAAFPAAVPAPSLPYDLLAVVNHSGSMAQGHYTAFVREVGRWFRFDDTWVREVEEEEVLASEAYLLFYFQRGAETCWRPPAPAAPTPPSNRSSNSNGACSPPMSPETPSGALRSAASTVAAAAAAAAAGAAAAAAATTPSSVKRRL